MRLGLASYVLACVLGLATSSHTSFLANLSEQECVKFPAAETNAACQDYGKCSCVKALDKKAVTMPTGVGISMYFELVYTAPGDIREVHWHINSGEMLYVAEGTCEFTLIDTKGRYNMNTAHTGDLLYFPKGYAHYFQGIDPELGCTMLLWFDTNSVNIDWTHVIGELPRDVLRKSLNNIPPRTLRSLKYPLYDPKSSDPKGVHVGTLPSEDEPKCKGGKCDDSLKYWPVFPVKGGKITTAPGAAVEYAVRADIFPALETMSGGILELEEGALREIHWHTNSEEQIYCLEGVVRITVYGVDQDTRKDVYEEVTLYKGDLVVIPLNYVHYIYAYDGSAKVFIAFNSPQWESQGFSQVIAVTPKRITADTFDTTKTVIDTYFPDKAVEGGVLPPKY